jgi:hypothetical protein
MSGKDDLKPAAHFSFTKEKRFERRQIITTTTYNKHSTSFTVTILVYSSLA